MQLIKQIAVSVAAIAAATSLVYGAGQQASESSRSNGIPSVRQGLKTPVLPTSVGLSAQQSPDEPSLPKKFRQIDVPGAIDTLLTGINPQGDIVGYTRDGSGYHGLLLNLLNFDPNPIYTAHGDFTNMDLTFTTPSLTAGQKYVITVTADEGSSFDAIVTLKDPNGNIVVNAQDTGIDETINFSAEVTGQYTIIVMSFGRTRGLFTVNVYNGVTTIDVPGAIYGTQAYGINPQGDIVGSYDFLHGFLLSNGAFTTIDAPGATFTFASGINRQGDIVGIYHDSNFTYHGFLLSNGVFTTIDVPAATNYTDAHGINSRGDIVGRYDDSSGSHGFLLRNGSFTTIDVPGAAGTEAKGINRQGDIVGDSFDSSFNFRGFLLRNGAFTTIDLPASTFTEAFGIDPRDDIVGEFYDSSFRAHGYLLSR